MERRRSRERVVELRLRNLRRRHHVVPLCQLKFVGYDAVWAGTKLKNLNVLRVTLQIPTFENNAILAFGW